MPGEIRIVDPPTGSKMPKGQEFTISCDQQIQGSDGVIATTQFTNHPGGPWVTSRAIGGGGALECNPVPWSGQDPSFSLQGVLNQNATVRVVVFGNEGLNSPPVLFSQSVSWTFGPTGQTPDD